MPKTDNFTMATMPTGRSAKTLFALIFSALIVSSAPAQQAVTVRNGVTPNVAMPVGHLFGDTINHNVHILSFEPAAEIATTYMRSPKHYVVLAVVPGKDIEVIAPGPMKISSMGDNTFLMPMTRYEYASVGDGRSKERQDYEACRQRRAYEIARKAAAERASRDSSGKRVREAPSGLDFDTTPCEMPTGDTKAGTLTRRALGKRPDAERYLVVMTSSSDIGAAELNKRLNTLTTVATTVGQTIESIALGIFAGKSGTYGGTWVQW